MSEKANNFATFVKLVGCSRIALSRFVMNILRWPENSIQRSILFGSSLLLVLFFLCFTSNSPFRIYWEQSELNHSKENESLLSLTPRSKPLIIHRLRGHQLSWNALEQLAIDRGRTLLLDRNRSSASPSLCLHLLRASGVNCNYTEFVNGSGRELLQPFTDMDMAIRQFGQPVIFRSPNGARFPTKVQGFSGSSDLHEVHRDQTLATLAELGMPLESPIRLANDDRVYLRDVLSDSVANFHLGQRELEWTCVAYSLLLPPQRTWVNKFSEQFDFDQLAVELIRRKMSDTCCGGTHRLMALTFLLRANKIETILSPKVQERVQQYIQSYVTLVVQSQNSQGFWTEVPEINAITPKQNEENSIVREHVLFTGHLAEWLLYVPLSFDVPDSTIDRAASWLVSKTKDVDDEELYSSFCPYSHALIVLSSSEQASGIMPPP